MVLGDVQVLHDRRERFHGVGQAVGDGVELLVRGLVAAPLRVLEQSDEQERDACGDGVDHQLPRIDRAEEGEARTPEDHEQDAEDEEPSPAHEVRRTIGELVEQRHAWMLYPFGGDTNRIVAGQRAVSVTGRWRMPLCLLVRVHSTGPVTSNLLTWSSRAMRIRRISSRARLAPRQ